MYLLGFDSGTSAVKATLLDAQTGKVLASASSPEREMPVAAPQPGWAEQQPQMWWDNLVAATARLRQQAGADLRDVAAVGVSYQMHGLVLVDHGGQVLRPAILWCDNRAVEIGQQAARDLGPDTCLKHLLNLPGNFTLTRLAWVKHNEPDLYRRAFKALLPGDWLAWRMTGRMCTTPSGLSEWIGWDFQENAPARLAFERLNLSLNLVPDLVDTFSVQGELTPAAAAELGLRPNTPVAYRAGDQPNNALSLNVLQPGEIAATAGTSGVVYGIGDQPRYDPKSRVNSFLHVNHRPDAPRYGVLLCVNGAGCLNSWLKHQVMSAAEDYPQMNDLAAQTPVGADGLIILPYGNSAERTLENRDLGAQICGLQFHRHTRAHLLRAAQEGIVFGLYYGLEIMRQMGLAINTVRAGHANMFLSPLFAAAFAALTGARVELYNTDGSQGAARGAGLGAGLYRTEKDAFVGLQTTRVIEPDPKLAGPCQEAYARWKQTLLRHLA